MKRILLILGAILSVTSLLAQTQYDYYDDSAVAGGADRALNGILFILLLVVGAFILLLLGGLYYKIKFWLYPEESPEYKAKIRREQQEKANRSKQTNSNISSAKQPPIIEETTSPKVSAVIAPQTVDKTTTVLDEGYKSYVKSFGLTIKPESKDVMKDLYSYKMYEGNKLISASNGAGTTRRKYDINPKEGTLIICDFAYDDDERRFERSIIIPNSVMAIGNNAFEFLNLHEITIPSSVKVITGNPFGSICKNVQCQSNHFSFEDGYLLSHEQSLLIADLTVGEKIKRTPKGIKYIGRGAYKLQDLQLIRIDSSVVAIADNGFGGRNIKAIVFEGKTMIVEESVFKRCPNLKAIYVPQNTMSHFKELVPNDFVKYLIEMGQEEVTDNEIIHKIALSEDINHNLNSIANNVLKQTVTITKEEQAYIDKEKKNYSLTTRTEEDYENKVIDWGLHKNEPHESYDSGEALYTADGKKLLEITSQEHNYKIKMGTKIICDAAFQNVSSDITISFPSTVKVLGNFLYWGAERETFEIPKSVQKITGNPFATCEGSIDCKSPYFIFEKGVLYDKEKKRVLSVMWDWQTKDADLDPNVIIICRDAFYERRLYDYNLIMPTNLRYIGDGAFSNSRMQNYVLSDKLVEIGKSAFSSSNIKHVELPSSLTKLGQEAFSSCDSLESAVLSPNMGTIEEETFYRCEKLKKVIIPEGVKVLKSRCFLFCNHIEEVYLPSSLVKIEVDAFAATNLLSVVVSKNTIIEDGAFPKNCEIIYRD